MRPQNALTFTIFFFLLVCQSNSPSVKVCFYFIFFLNFEFQLLSQLRKRGDMRLRAIDCAKFETFDREIYKEICKYRIYSLSDRQTTY